jgi:hypothetical protein
MPKNNYEPSAIGVYLVSDSTAAIAGTVFRAVILVWVIATTLLDDITSFGRNLFWIRFGNKDGERDVGSLSHVENSEVTTVPPRLALLRPRFTL